MGSMQYNVEFGYQQENMQYKFCEVCTEWNYEYNAVGGDNIFHKSNQQIKSLIPCIKMTGE
jgi:hypothetical protein